MSVNMAVKIIRRLAVVLQRRLPTYIVIIGIDTSISVIVVSPTTWEAPHSPRTKPEDLGSSPQPEGEARGLWWASQVVGDTTMTEIEVSISILSWCLKTY